jgi:hypothetical protein
LFKLLPFGVNALRSGFGAVGSSKEDKQKQIDTIKVDP